MDAGVMAVGVGVFALLGFVLLGGPILVGDWSRARRRSAMERQIALTDALDTAIGPLVAPVVTKPLFGPWEIHMAVPMTQSATVARVLSVVEEVLSDVRRPESRSYRIFLTARSDAQRGLRASGTPRWAT